MITDLKKKEIQFHVNNIILDNSNNNISYVDGRPVHMAFIMAYLCNKNLLNKQIDSPSNEQTIFDDNNNLQTLDLRGGSRFNKNSSNFKFSMDGGNVILLELKDQKFKPTMSLAIGTNEQDKKEDYIHKTCKELFDLSGNHDMCAKHYYSIFSGCAISMMRNFGDIIKTKKDVVNTILKAHPGILYEILKNLNWKLKINNGQKEMVNVETWLSKLPNNQAEHYGKYLKDNQQITDLLNKIVQRINSDPSTLEIKYNNFINSNGHKLRNKKKILNPLRAQALYNKKLQNY
jgi:predicted 3-demethylubiquinone-9 3-methyltransferase (glyoxalase superfamily)